MKQVKIIRCERSDEKTISLMLIDSKAFAVILELPWKDNQQNISCIPKGSYLCQLRWSPHFGNVYEIKNVLNRDNVLIHYGNTTADVKGCLLIGQGIRGNEVVYSRITFDCFMQLMDKEDFNLEIIEV